MPSNSLVTNSWPVIKPNDRRLFIDAALNRHWADKKVKITKEQTQKSARIVAAVCDLKSEPNDNAGLDAQLLRGEAVTIHASTGNWLLVQSARDYYCGWCHKDMVSHNIGVPTHKVVAPRTFCYSKPDMKSPRTANLSMGSMLRVKGEELVRDTKYLILENDEAVIASHLVSLDSFGNDFVSYAEMLIHTPYLWGGSSGIGLDCSGLVQLSLRMAGIETLRDSDMLAASCGKICEPGKDWQELMRGDLIFWPGHIAICQGKIDDVQWIIHANGASMDVKSEPFEIARKRIAHLYSQPIGMRRLHKLNGKGESIDLAVLDLV